VEFDSDGPAYAVGDAVLGGRLVALDARGDRLATERELMDALEAYLSDGSVPGADWVREKAEAAIALATQYSPGEDSMEVKAGQRLWTSKYALTKGIEEVVSREDARASGYISLEGHFWTLLKVGRDIHATREEAVSAAEAMRVKKLNSLRKQIKKIEALTF